MLKFLYVYAMYTCIFFVKRQRGIKSVKYGQL